jgi:serine/threonine-protein kinase RsbT
VINLKKRFDFFISSEEDIISARQRVRQFATELGFEQTDTILIATAVSEITRNIIKYAKNGKIEFSSISLDQKEGIEIYASDEGPGIPDIELALQDGFSTGFGLGLGLPGAKRLMDEFEIESKVNLGTTIKMRKWIEK